MERRADIAPSAAKSRSGFARGTVEFVVVSLPCFGTLVNMESL